jgi:hypothetical protein
MERDLRHQGKNASSKNKRIGKDSAELSTYTSNHINKSSSHSSDTTGRG